MCWFGGGKVKASDRCSQCHAVCYSTHQHQHLPTTTTQPGVYCTKPNFGYSHHSSMVYYSGTKTFHGLPLHSIQEHDHLVPSPPTEVWFSYPKLAPTLLLGAAVPLWPMPYYSRVVSFHLILVILVILLLLYRTRSPFPLPASAAALSLLRFVSLLRLSVPSMLLLPVRSRSIIPHSSPAFSLRAGSNLCSLDIIASL